MSKNLIIFGKGELAEVIAFYFKHDSDYQVKALTVDGDSITDSSQDGLPIIPFEEIEGYHRPEENHMFVALSYRDVNKVRQKKYLEAKSKGYHLASYVCSKAITWPDLKIGENTFIFESNVIQPFVSIGNNCIIWSGNHIGHHAKIMDHCFLASHIVVSGGVTIEPLSFIGVNVTLRDHITVASENILGAGALIVKNTEANCVYLGTPARIKGRSEEQKRI